MLSKYPILTSVLTGTAAVVAAPSFLDLYLGFDLQERGIGSTCIGNATEDLGPGTCKDVSDPSSCGGRIYSGACPNDPADVKCCVEYTCETDHVNKTTNEIVSWGTGICRNVDQSPCYGGDSYSGFCPGPANIMCCVLKPENSGSTSLPSATAASTSTSAPTPSASTSSTPSTSKTSVNIGGIAGGVVGGLAFLVLLALILPLYRRLNRVAPSISEKPSTGPNFLGFLRHRRSSNSSQRKIYRSELDSRIRVEISDHRNAPYGHPELSTTSTEPVELPKNHSHTELPTVAVEPVELQSPVLEQLSTGAWSSHVSSPISPADYQMGVGVRSDFTPVEPAELASPVSPLEQQRGFSMYSHMEFSTPVEKPAESLERR